MSVFFFYGLAALNCMNLFSFPAFLGYYLNWFLFLLFGLSG